MGAIVTSVRKAAVFGIGVIAVFAGCAGGAPTLPFSPATTAQQAMQTKEARRSRIPVVVRIRIPRHHRQIRVRIVRDGRPAYVSPSTKAMTITVLRGSQTVLNQTVALAPGSPFCSPGYNGLTTCYATIMLPPCPGTADCYTASVSTFDAVFCNGAPLVCSIPQNANELSTAQNVPFDVAVGTGNLISFVLYGVPFSLNVAYDSLTKPSGGAYELIGPGAHIFTVAALDADGNAIVGPGSPTFTVSSATGSLAPVTVAIASSAPNQIWVTPPTAFDGTDTASFGIRPTYAGQSTDGCSQPQANCNATSVAVGMEQMYVLSNQNQVFMYALGESTPRVSWTSYHGYGLGLASDSAGDIFVPAGSPTIFSPPLSYGYPSVLSCCDGSTIAVSPGSDGNAFFVSQFSTPADPENVVSSCSPTTCTTTTYILPSNLNQVFAADATGDLAFGVPNLNNDQPCFALAYSPQHYNTPLHISGSPFAATGCAMRVAFDPSGNLFASDPNNGQILEFSKSSGYQTITTISTGSVTPWTLLADSSGNIFDFATPSTNSVGILQETLATTLAGHQGGSVSPDQTAGVAFTGPLYSYAMAIGPSGIYVESYGNQGGPTLSGYAIPSLASLGTPTANNATSASGLLVLP